MKKFPKLRKLTNFKPLSARKRTNTRFGLWSTTKRRVLFSGPRRDRSHQTFASIWSVISCWHSFWYVTDGWKVYPMYIESEDHLISKTYMTRVEGENTRLRHYLARLHRKTLCYSKSLTFLQYSIRLLLYYLRFDTVPSFS